MTVDFTGRDELASLRKNLPILGWLMLVGVALLVLMMIGVFIMPTFEFMLLSVFMFLGSPLNTLTYGDLGPLAGVVLLFHLFPVGVAIMFRLVGLTFAELTDFRRNPHRLLVLACAIIVHASFFGRFLYPNIPSGWGGGRPIPVTLTTQSEAITGYLAMRSEPFLVVLRSTADSGSYCPIAIRSDQVTSLHVRSGPSPRVFFQISGHC
jgi:hypothetical protein